MKVRFILLIFLCFDGLVGQPVTQYLASNNSADSQHGATEDYIFHHKPRSDLNISQGELSIAHGLMANGRFSDTQEGPLNIQDISTSAKKGPSKFQERPSTIQTQLSGTQNPLSEIAFSEKQTRLLLKKTNDKLSQISSIRSADTGGIITLKQKVNNKQSVNYYGSSTDSIMSESDTVKLNPQLLKLLYQTINETVEQMKVSEIKKEGKNYFINNNDNIIEIFHSTTQTHSVERIEVSSNIPLVQVSKTTESNPSTNKHRRITQVSRKSTELPARTMTTTSFSNVKTESRFGDNTTENITKFAKFSKTRQHIKLKRIRANTRMTLGPQTLVFKTLSNIIKQATKNDTKNLTASFNGSSLNNAQNLPPFLFNQNSNKEAASNFTTATITPATPIATVSTIPTLNTNKFVASSHIINDGVTTRTTQITIELTPSHPSYLNYLNNSSQSDNLTVIEFSQTENAVGHLYYNNNVETVEDEAAQGQDEVLPQPLPCLGTSSLEVVDNGKEGDIPLISISKISPHVLMLLVKPKIFVPNTQVKITYERVRSDGSDLSDPMVEYMALKSTAQYHALYNLKEGQYLVCGEARLDERILQTSCLEANVDKMEWRNVLPAGVIAIIVLAILVLFGVFIYAIYYSIVISRRNKKQRELQEKVDRFAKKEKEICEKELAASHLYTAVYPDPNEPYEERCIM